MNATTTTTTTKSPRSRENQIGGFLADKVKGDVMRAYVKRKGLSIDTDVEDEQLALAMVQHFRSEATNPDEELVTCTNCKGAGPADVDCPLCGDPGEELDDGEGAITAARTEAVDDIEDAADDDDDAPSPSTAMAHQPPRELDIPRSPKRSVAELDEAVKEIKRLGAEAMTTFYELCRQVLRVNKQALWKLRTDDSGGLAYTSFEQFARIELGFSPTQAYGFIDCARNYKSAKEIAELGGKSKAILVLKAAPADRERIAAKAKAGATEPELRKEVTESRKREGSPKKATQHSKAGTASAAKRKAAKELATKAKAAERITVASILGSKTVRVYVRPPDLPTNMKGIAWPPPKRATTATFARGIPTIARRELGPGVFQYFSIMRADASDDGTPPLLHHVQTVREDA